MLPDRVSNPGPLTYESGALFIYLFILTFENKMKSATLTEPDPLLYRIYMYVCV